MKTHVLVRPGEIVFQEVPCPTPGPGEIVMRIRAALTCGTDVKAFLRGHPKFPMPTPFGHEFAGEVAAVGAQVRGFRDGDAIMAMPTAPCGACYYCERQQENLCETVMETMVLGALRRVHQAAGAHRRAPTSIRSRRVCRSPWRALLEPLSCVVHGLESLSLRPDDTRGPDRRRRDQPAAPAGAAGRRRRAHRRRRALAGTRRSTRASWGADAVFTRRAWRRRASRSSPTLVAAAPTW